MFTEAFPAPPVLIDAHYSCLNFAILVVAMLNDVINILAALYALGCHTPLVNIWLSRPSNTPIPVPPLQIRSGYRTGSLVPITPGKASSIAIPNDALTSSQHHHHAK